MGKEENKQIVIRVSLCYTLVFTFIFLLTRLLPLLFARMELQQVIKSYLSTFIVLLLILVCLFAFAYKLRIYSRPQNHPLILLISGTLLMISAVISFSNAASNVFFMAAEISKVINSMSNTGSQNMYNSLYGNISIAVIYFFQVLIGIYLIFVARKKEKEEK
ncbi:MAG: hypothetical protein GX144_06800 [Clostridiaceae bacterium]|nr:hypothetical protein [Clostridiaceae bacterium]